MNCLLLMLDWMLDDGERVLEKNKIRGKRFEGGFSAGGKIKLLRFKSFDAIRAYYDYNQRCSCNFFSNKKAKSVA